MLAPTDTVTVRSAANVSPSVTAVTVTSVASSFSETLDGFSRSVRSVLSSSVRVTLAPLTVTPVDVPSTLIGFVAFHHRVLGRRQGKRGAAAGLSRP